jgi:hypothetical protein
VTATNSGALANTFFGVVRIGPQNLQGMVMTGWGAFGSTAVTPVNIGVLAQQPDGTLKLVTGDYVSNPLTRGGGSVVIADFNGDGRDDIFLAAHNESPFKQEPSVALISNAQGSFTRVDIADSVMAHDAELSMLNGKPTVVTSSFNESGKPFTSPWYQWNGTSFNVTESAQRDLSGSNGMSVAVADFNGDGTPEIAIGDFVGGPGYPYSPANPQQIALYSFAGNDIGNAPLAVLVPYFQSRPEYANVISAWGPAVTHSYRTWVDDFNHDGRPDLVVAQSLWTPANNNWPAMLQMLQNDGNFHFRDVSDTLNPDFDKSGAEVDYQMQRVDIDGSGILSYLSGIPGVLDLVNGQYVARDDRQQNFLLVNDGTGRLHVALHDQFVAWGKQVLAYAAAIYHDTSVLWTNPNGPTPAFHAYLAADGGLNFVAEVLTSSAAGGLQRDNSAILVNVPVEYDLRTDFTEAIRIDDRNGSQLMRTFAGNDRVADANHAASAHIDGGLGIDTAAYSGARASYNLSRSGADISVTAAGLQDTLHDFERIEFNDTKLALDVDGNAGLVARLLGAVFGAPSVQNAGYAGIGLSYADGGMSALALAGLALSARLGSHPTNAQVVDLLFSNVVGLHPDATQLAHYQDMLDTGAQTAASLTLLAAQSAENAAHIGLAGIAATGLAYY